MAHVRPMLQDFPRWLAVTAIAADEGRRNARWAGVCSLVDGSSSELTEALVRLALHSKRHPAPQGSSQQIRDAFYAADNTFEMAGNDKEMRVLAGATLAALMKEGEESAASRTALAVSNALIGGIRKSDLPMDLSVLAEDSIVRLAENNSKRPCLSNMLSTDYIELDFEEAKTLAKEGNVPVAFQKAAEAIEASLESLVDAKREIVSATERYMQVRDEELDMLWWLVGGRSLDFDLPLDQVASAARPFVFAKELADLTHCPPGPRGVRSLLSRGGLKGEKIAITDALNAADPDWLRNFMSENEPSAVTLPLHFAAKRQLETGVGSAWIAGWAAATEVPASSALAALDLGLQLYRERLLILSAPK